MLYQILTKLGQNDQWVTNYKSYQQFDLKGHVGVTGVKKVIFTEKMLLLLHALLDFDENWSEASVGKWLQSYQQFDLKGHVEVTGVKKVIYFFFQNAPIELKF